MRIGHGYDVHKFDKKRKFILGGVNIEHYAGLLGHSDADVLVHAIIDSLLGAASLGDLGNFFPDTDDKLKNISSLVLLKKTTELLYENKFAIINIDSTIVLQRPRIKDLIFDMRTNISNTCKINMSQINIKATTEENLGFTGKEEGVCVHAVCLLNKIKT
ncbi:MAG: 2-C-methyl-D-erythritol 2,4-cyclodiphosphate synthase [Candidatus Improbicoccus pseudotrichonymphae]|uniref:2-C-methyl-D-erythritol 2,4-cyclodiphosphate synthase n=1 Tax=Candidatus Improbicoccus pseudotrichonymphae TaxID=3033792 RepID=A0AA48I7X1_9FIRM|nr:MAG: 2-C-methyl-D-erythritol 2,4-cyclodiphosphate synthase [Candidatus Improbicoccus pseudotrichonymphae]